jgi:hypothetical protein
LFRPGGDDERNVVAEGDLRQRDAAGDVLGQRLRGDRRMHAAQHARQELDALSTSLA